VDRTIPNEAHELNNIAIEMRGVDQNEKGLLGRNKTKLKCHPLLTLPNPTLTLNMLSPPAIVVYMFSFFFSLEEFCQAELLAYFL